MGASTRWSRSASACAATTGPEGVDRAALALAGWGDVATGEIDHNPVGWARSADNPFTLQITGSELGEPDHCWVSVEFKNIDEFDEVRRRLEVRFGRAPDSAEPDDMRTTAWVNAVNTVELWMMPAHEMCSECPLLFVTVDPRMSESAADGP